MTPPPIARTEPPPPSADGRDMPKRTSDPDKSPFSGATTHQLARSWCFGVGMRAKVDKIAKRARYADAVGDNADDITSNRGQTPSKVGTA